MATKVLLVCGALQTFTKIDLDILNQSFETRYALVKRDSLRNLICTILASVRQVYWSDVTIAWFGSYFAFFPLLACKILGKKSAIIASGYDVADQPEIDYGNMRPGIRRWVGRANYALAELILPVSEFSRSEAIENAGANPKKIRVIEHGIPGVSTDESDIVCKEKVRQVLTVGNVTRNNLVRKGYYTFVRTAALMPDTEFLLVGPHLDDSVEELRRIAPANLRIVGPLYGESLREMMCKSKVYAQLSYYESFGMALAESMAMGCIPVVAQRASLPEVVGDAGIQVPYGDVEATALAMHRALDMGDEAGDQARKRIEDHFSLERRSEKLTRCIRELVDDVSSPSQV